MQLGHSVEMFLRTYAKSINGGQNALAMGRLEEWPSHWIYPRFIPSKAFFRLTC
jgi:hypothetical protein